MVGRENIVNEIKKTIENEKHENSAIGPLGGLSGLAMFHFNFSRKFNDQDSDDLANSLLLKSISMIDAGFLNPNFSIGLSGFGWSLLHFKKSGFLNEDLESILQPIDHFSGMSLKSNLESNNLDYFTGATGEILYFLSRYEFKGNSSEYMDYFTAYIDVAENENFNYVEEFSFPHGYLSVLNMLARLMKVSQLSPRIEKILIKCVDPIVKKFHANRNNPLSIFNNEQLKETRLAWCFGDLAFGTTIYKIGEVLKKNNLVKIGTEIILHSSKRKELRENMIIDSGICHGIFGIAQVYRYFYNKTQHNAFLQAYNYWIEKGISFISSEGGLNLKQWNGRHKADWVYKSSLLEGSAGIGLVLMEADDMWDELMLLS